MEKMGIAPHQHLVRCDDLDGWPMQATLSVITGTGVTPEKLWQLRPRAGRYEISEPLKDVNSRQNVICRATWRHFGKKAQCQYYQSQAGAGHVATVTSPCVM